MHREAIVGLPCRLRYHKSAIIVELEGANPSLSWRVTKRLLRPPTYRLDSYYVSSMASGWVLAREVDIRIFWRLCGIRGEGRCVHNACSGTPHFRRRFLVGWQLVCSTTRDLPYQVTDTRPQ